MGQGEETRGRGWGRGRRQETGVGQGEETRGRRWGRGRRQEAGGGAEETRGRGWGRGRRQEAGGGAGGVAGGGDKRQGVGQACHAEMVPPGQKQQKVAAIMVPP